MPTPAMWGGWYWHISTLAQRPSGSQTLNSGKAAAETALIQKPCCWPAIHLIKSNVFGTLTHILSFIISFFPCSPNTHAHYASIIHLCSSLLLSGFPLCSYFAVCLFHSFPHFTALSPSLLWLPKRWWARDGEGVGGCICWLCWPDSVG